MLSTTEFLFLIWGIVAFGYFTNERRKQRLAALEKERAAYLNHPRVPSLTDDQRRKSLRLSVAGSAPEEQAKWLASLESQLSLQNGTRPAKKSYQYPPTPKAVSNLTPAREAELLAGFQKAVNRLSR